MIAAYTPQQLRSARNDMPSPTASLRDGLSSWLDYLSWRSKLALQTYCSAFVDDRSLRSENAYQSAKDIHSFLTHAALVARAFIPARQVNDRTKKRADALKRQFGLDLKVFQSCLSARHDLDHFDERMDAVLAQPNAIVGNATLILSSKEGLKHLGGRPTLVMLIYLRSEHAIVTYSKSGTMMITPLAPIRRELEYVRSRCISIMEHKKRAQK